MFNASLSSVHQVRTLLIPWPYGCDIATLVPAPLPYLTRLYLSFRLSFRFLDHAARTKVTTVKETRTAENKRRCTRQVRLLHLQNPSQGPLSSPPSPPPPNPPPEVRRGDEWRGQLLHLRSPPPPMPRLRCQTSRMVAGNDPLPVFPHTPSHISQENRNVLDLRDKIKTFLASQGMIKGHSGAAPRAAEQEPQILALSADYVSPTNSPQTPTLSISSTNDERPSSYPLRTDRYPDNDRKTPCLPLVSPPNPPQVYLSCTS